MAQKKGLGRGLDSLFNSTETGDSKKDSKKTNSGVIQIDVIDIQPNKAQPRRTFNEETLRELADSIKEEGVIQPIIVKEINNGYELIAGERRLKATKMAGIKTIPAIIKNVEPNKNALLALLENIQREDLNPIDEALAFQNIKKKFRVTQEKLAQMTGKGRAYIANSLRLLTLPQKVLDYVAEGKISTGHAKVLLSVLTEQTKIELAELIVKKNIAVRDLEKIIKKGSTRPPLTLKKGDDIIAVEDALLKKYGYKINIITKDRDKGKIEFIFNDKAGLNDLIELLLE